ncbi:hypothetical protein L6452_05897 [Arctium lappa]|uniref:Uncharacterized protein n=1 Tax=Arctium lappa TaxID=4217 RepID=A0ACB9EIQ6_ARCLA|nr:hypothetical protein L6452_05897 [Arctium lappa]
MRTTEPETVIVEAAAEGQVETAKNVQSSELNQVVDMEISSLDEEHSISGDVNPMVEMFEGGEKGLTEVSITEKSTLEPIDLESELDPQTERERTERALISIKVEVDDLFQFSDN